MKILSRIERLEARVPKGKSRVILVWMDRSGRRTKVADTNPELPDLRIYDVDSTSCKEAHGIYDAAQTN